jgi:hypothetical protein
MPSRVLSTKERGFDQFLVHFGITAAPPGMVSSKGKSKFGLAALPIDDLLELI